MANDNIWRKLKGLVNGFLKFGFTGPHVEKDSIDPTQLNVRANDGSSDATVNVATTHSDIVEVEAADGNKTSITMASGAGGDLNFTLPNTDGNANDVLTTDGSGNLSWSGASGALQVSTYSYTLNFNTSSPLNLYNAPNNTLVDKIVFDVTTAFNATGPTVATGISGDTSKFTDTDDVDLTTVGTYIIDVQKIQVSAAQIIATFAAGAGGTAGTARITTYTSIPG